MQKSWLFHILSVLEKRPKIALKMSQSDTCNVTLYYQNMQHYEQKKICLIHFCISVLNYLSL